MSVEPVTSVFERVTVACCFQWLHSEKLDGVHQEEALSPQNVLMLRSNVFLFVSAPGEPRDAFTGCKFMSESGVHVTKRAHSGYSPPNVHTLF